MFWFIITLFSMIFLHIVDDYYLQGILAKMKQKKWWNENAPDNMYKNDYIVALIMHSFSWTFMIMLPAAATIVFLKTGLAQSIMYFFCFGFNWLIHAATDNAKANEGSINLIVDQAIHICQIITTWSLVVMPALLVGLGLV